MQVRFGTSGFSYEEWRGTFYPARLPAARMLSFYGQQLPTVELNSTFYRMPREEALAKWHDSVPRDFRFAVKAPRGITHLKKLKDASEAAGFFFLRLRTLGDKCGPVLFQLPPSFKKDRGRLAAFLGSIPASVRAAFEFRNASWFSDDTYQLLADHGCALVGGDLDEERPAPPLQKTASYCYLRLRRESYQQADLERWARRLSDLGVSEVFGYFKHERQGPELAGKMNQLLG